MSLNGQTGFPPSPIKCSFILFPRQKDTFCSTLVDLAIFFHATMRKSISSKGATVYRFRHINFMVISPLENIFRKAIAASTVTTGIKYMANDISPVDIFQYHIQSCNIAITRGVCYPRRSTKILCLKFINVYCNFGAMVWAGVAPSLHSWAPEVWCWA
jgi:hypothetical protein